MHHGHHTGYYRTGLHTSFLYTHASHTDTVIAVVVVIIILTRGNPLVAQQLQTDVKSVWQWTLHGPVIIDKTIMQQNRVIKQCYYYRYY